jgi:Uma2 family endonuclease
VSDPGPPRPPNVDPALLEAVERLLHPDRAGAQWDPAGEENEHSGHGGEAGREQSNLSTPSPEGTVQTLEPRPYGRMSPGSYLVRERAAEERSEYFDGQVVAMAGGTTVHAGIAQNIGAHLYFRLPGGCRVYQNDVKVQAADARAYMYPDVFVVCGEPGYIDRRHDVVTNPTVVFEVLSPGTERHDRTVKAAAYRAVASLAAYVLVSQKEPRVEVYTRGEDGGWACAVYQRLEHEVPLPALGCGLTVAEIYRNLFPAPPA